jgi:hypothetical protein
VSFGAGFRFGPGKEKAQRRSAVFEFGFAGLLEVNPTGVQRIADYPPLAMNGIAVDANRLLPLQALAVGFAVANASRSLGPVGFKQRFPVLYFDYIVKVEIGKRSAAGALQRPGLNRLVPPPPFGFGGLDPGVALHRIGNFPRFERL